MLALVKLLLYAGGSLGNDGILKFDGGSNTTGGAAMTRISPKKGDYTSMFSDATRRRVKTVLEVNQLAISWMDQAMVEGRKW